MALLPEQLCADARLRLEGATGRGKARIAHAGTQGAKLFMQSLDEAGFGEGKVGPGRPRKDAEMDANFLLLRTPEEVEQWERLKDAGEVQDLPQFAPPEAPKKRGFPEYPEGDLIARALRLAFVDGEGEGDSTE